MKYIKSMLFFELFELSVIRPSMAAMFDFKCEGIENVPTSGPVVVTPKHQSWMDLFAMALAFPRRMNYMAKYELFDNITGDFGGPLSKIGKITSPFTAKALEWLGAFPVDRENPARMVSSFKHVVELLTSDDYVSFFPEGHIVKGEVGEFKTAFINMLLKIQKKYNKAIKFVPVGISYGKGTIRQKLRMKIGKPIEFEPDCTNASEILREEVTKLTNFQL